ncbi:trigger factor [Puniceicoccaceae bacterium K14]|nr:trigger factor [Puniceicoccaceae bacterium K14]
MKIDLQDVTDTRKTLAVTLESSEIEAEEKSLLAQFSNQAKIPGFRPGKAPLAMVKKRYAKEVKSELNNRILSKAYQEGSKESKVELINVVDVDQKEVTSGEDATFKFTIDVKPQFEVPEYKGLELTAISEEVEDKDVDDLIQNIRAERADFEPVERAAEKSDYVKFSHEGKIDGKEISEIVADKPVYSKMPQTWEEVGGENGLIPGLSAELEGLKVGDKKDIEVEFPADFHVEGLREKKAVYSVEVLEVRERKLPEMDEEFFKAQQVKDLDELKERVSTFIKNRKAQEKSEDLRRQAGEKLLEAVDFQLPVSLVENETQGALQQLVQNNARRGVSEEDLESRKDELHANAVKTANERVKMQFILGEIAAKEEISVADEDMSRYIMGLAQQSGKKPDAIVKELRKDQNRLRQIQQSLLFDKALEFLVDQAKVSDASK